MDSGTTKNLDCVVEKQPTSPMELRNTTYDDEIETLNIKDGYTNGTNGQRILQIRSHVTLYFNKKKKKQKLINELLFTNEDILNTDPHIWVKLFHLVL